MRILVVDDELGIRKIFEKILRRAGHTPQAVESAERALELLEEHEFDLVISDLALPKVGGAQLARTLRGRWPHLPVILLTGEPNPEGAAQAQQLGNCQYLRKPVLREQLLQAVSSASTSN